MPGLRIALLALVAVLAFPSMAFAADYMSVDISYYGDVRQSAKNKLIKWPIDSLSLCRPDGTAAVCVPIFVLERKRSAPHRVVVDATLTGEYATPLFFVRSRARFPRNKRRVRAAEELPASKVLLADGQMASLLDGYDLGKVLGRSTRGFRTSRSGEFHVALDGNQCRQLRVRMKGPYGLELDNFDRCYSSEEIRDDPNLRGDSAMIVTLRAKGWRPIASDESMLSSECQLTRFANRFGPDVDRPDPVRCWDGRCISTSQLSVLALAFRRAGWLATAVSSKDASQALDAIAAYKDSAVNNGGQQWENRYQGAEERCLSQVDSSLVKLAEGATRALSLDVRDPDKQLQQLQEVRRQAEARAIDGSELVGRVRQLERVRRDDLVQEAHRAVVEDDGKALERFRASDHPCSACQVLVNEHLALAAAARKSAGYAELRAAVFAMYEHAEALRGRAETLDDTGSLLGSLKGIRRDCRRALTSVQLDKKTADKIAEQLGRAETELLELTKAATAAGAKES